LRLEGGEGEKSCKKYSWNGVRKQLRRGVAYINRIHPQSERGLYKKVAGGGKGTKSLHHQGLEKRLRTNEEKMHGVARMHYDGGRHVKMTADPLGKCPQPREKGPGRGVFGVMVGGGGEKKAVLKAHEMQKTCFRARKDPDSFPWGGTNRKIYEQD